MTVLEVLKTVLFIIEIVLGLGLVIFIHEAGHFFMAKKNKVRVEAFSLGFGPPIWRKKKGDTEYRISWIPLGGYVKMAGESFAEERSGKPDELTSKTAWQRFQIFVAGALMNLVIAFPIAIAAYAWGKYEMSPEIGVPGVPETYAGMLPGDVILEVAGTPIHSGEEYRIELVRQSKGTKVPVKVRRGEQILTLDVEQRGSEGHRTLPYLTTLGKLAEGSAFAKAGLRAGDEIIGVDGQNVYHGTQVMEAVRNKGGKTVMLRVRRRDEQGKVLETDDVQVMLPVRKVKRFPEESRLIQPIVGKVSKGYPAFGKLEKDDEILEIDGKPIKSFQDLKNAVEPGLGRVLTFKVRRKEKDSDKLVEKTFDIQPTYGDTGKGQIGMAPKDTKIIADLDEGGFFYGKGLRSKDQLSAVEGRVGDIFVKDITAAAIGEGKTSLKVDVIRDGKSVPLELTATEAEECDFAQLGMEMKKGQLGWDIARVFHRRSIGGALREGMYEPYNIGKLTLQLLLKLFTAEEPASGLAGPVGIFQVSYHSAEQSLGNLLWLLCLITVNLGVFNLLPIPILDGGHVVLLAIEKFRGKPPSEKFIAIFQYVGLVFLLALIIFVTYNDIGRIIGG